MEMALQMPSNYVEVTEDEMMYVDGGESAYEKAKWMVFGAIGTSLMAFTGKSISASLVGLAVSQAGWALTAAINSTIVAATLNPGAALVIGSATVYGVYKVGQKAKLW